jgi:prepilin-type N-terminal cleavage/methylation domain-containing protein
MPALYQLGLSSSVILHSFCNISATNATKMLSCHRLILGYKHTMSYVLLSRKRQGCEGGDCRGKGQGRGGFTLLELLVVISVILLLAMLIMGSFNYVMQRSETIRCINSMRQVAAALHSYRGDHGGWFPPGYPVTASSGEFGVIPEGALSGNLTLHHHLIGYLTDMLYNSAGTASRGEFPFCPGGMGGAARVLDEAERVVRTRGSYALNTLLIQFRFDDFPPARSIILGTGGPTSIGVAPSRDSFDDSRYPMLLEVRSDGSGMSTWSFTHQNQALNGSFGETGDGWGKVSPGRSHGYGDALNFLFMAGNVETVPRNDFSNNPSMNKSWHLPNNPMGMFHGSGTVPSGVSGRTEGAKVYFMHNQLSVDNFKALYPHLSKYEKP